MTSPENTAHCPGCEQITAHQHLHDTAHGIAETHMVGSERFECTACGHVTTAGDPAAGRFNFTLDPVRAS